MSEALDGPSQRCLEVAVSVLRNLTKTNPHHYVAGQAEQAIKLIEAVLEDAKLFSGEDKP